MTFRPLAYNFAYTISKSHPYTTESFTPEEAFEALRLACATVPDKIFSMEETGYLFTDPRNKNTYLIGLQE